jgi:molybdenum cofactor biosynthesis enzyme MoaA
VRARIDEALARGTREIVLTGGEPGMRGDLVALVAHAHAGGAERVVLETNATVLETRALALRAAGLDAVRVNVPAWGEACDALTRDTGGFARALASMQALAREGVAIEAAVTLVRSALEHLPAIPARLHEALGASLRAIVVAFPVDAADPHELLSFEEAAAAVLALERSARHAGVTPRMSVGDSLPPCAFAPHARSHVTRLYAMTTGAPPRPGYTHLEACTHCRIRDRCFGVADAHTARFGVPVMHPVGDDRTRRRLTLVSNVDDQILRELTSSHHYTDTHRVAQTEELVRVIYRCNQSCTFCFVSTHLPAPPPDVVANAIRAAASRGTRVVLSGGEPTLDPRLVEWVRLARSLSQQTIILQTNAIRLEDPALVARLEDAGLDEAFVSLHGATAEVSDAVTEAPGTFVRTVAGIDRLHASRIRVMLNYVLCEKNRHELVTYVRMIAARWPKALLNLSFIGPSTDMVPRDRGLIPRYSDTLPVIAEALSEARRLGVYVNGMDSMCGLPLCLVPGGIEGLALAEIPPGFDSGEEFIKTDACAQCVMGKKCWGLRRGYAEIHGTGELHAIGPSATA